MSTIFLVSYVALWVLFISQSFVILLLLRQVGVLNLRIAPRGARVLPKGPEIGQKIPAVTLTDMDDRRQELSLSPLLPKDALLLFLYPNCAVCDSLMPALKPFIAANDNDVFCSIVGLGNRESCQRFRQKHGLTHLLFANAPAMRESFNIGPTPFAVLIRKDGVVISKGVVNHMEHLESVLIPLVSEMNESVGR